MKSKTTNLLWENKGHGNVSPVKLFSVSAKHPSPQSHSCAISKTQKQRLDSSCFGRKFAQIKSTIQDQRAFRWMCILFFWGVFFTFESMHMIYEYWASGKNTFISSSKCQTQKQLGLHRRSALVILNVIRIERGSKLERNERLGEERQLEWACIWKRGRQSMIEDGVRGLAKQPWCNLSSCSWSFAASSRQSLFSLTSLLPPVQ